MVSMVNHGGHCCGARHLRGFGRAENANPNLINAAAQQVPDQRMTEVILNGTQVSQHPAVLQRLADLGFVLDGHWINGNHQSHNYRFSRCDDRRPLDLAGWNGMVMAPGLTGRLPQIPAGNPANRVPIAHYVRPLQGGSISANNEANLRHRWLGELYNFRRGRGGELPPTGRRFRINSPRSVHHGLEYVCIGQGGGYDRNVTLRFRGRSGNFEISRANCLPVDRVERVEPPAPAGRNIREFVVGDRIQVVREWPDNPEGLCGTVTAIRSLLQVEVQMDVADRPTCVSSTNYITIVGPDHAEVPRTRIAPPPAAALPPPPPPHRHDGADDRVVIQAAPARLDGDIVIGSRVCRINNQGGVVVVGMVGTVRDIRNGDDPAVRCNWDGVVDNTWHHLRDIALAAVAAPPPPPVEEPPRIVGSTYHCVFQNGTRGAGYDTLALARDQLGRRRRIDRRDFMSRGDARWAENVPY